MQACLPLKKVSGHLLTSPCKTSPCKSSITLLCQWTTGAKFGKVFTCHIFFYLKATRQSVFHLHHCASGLFFCSRNFPSTIPKLSFNSVYSVYSPLSSLSLLFRSVINKWRGDALPGNITLCLPHHIRGAPFSSRFMSLCRIFCVYEMREREGKRENEREGKREMKREGDHYAN